MLKPIFDKDVEGRKCRNLLALNHTALLYEKKILVNVGMSNLNFSI